MDYLIPHLRYMLLQNDKARNCQNADQGNQVHLTYVLKYLPIPFLGAPFAPNNNSYKQNMHELDNM